MKTHSHICPLVAQKKDLVFFGLPPLPVDPNQGCGIKGLIPTSVIQVGISPCMWEVLVFGVRPFLLYRRFVDSISHSPG